MVLEIAGEGNRADTDNKKWRFVRSNLFLSITKHNQKTTTFDLFRANRRCKGNRLRWIQIHLCPKAAKDLKHIH